MDWVTDAVPNKHFGIAPFRAELFNTDPDRTYAGVMGASGVNCLTFKSKPGAVITTFENAQQIADLWNRQEKP